MYQINILSRTTSSQASAHHSGDSAWCADRPVFLFPVASAVQCPRVQGNRTQLLPSSEAGFLAAGERSTQHCFWLGWEQQAADDLAAETLKSTPGRRVRAHGHPNNLLNCMYCWVRSLFRSGWLEAAHTCVNNCFPGFVKVIEGTLRG